MWENGDGSGDVADNNDEEQKGFDATIPARVQPDEINDEESSTQQEEHNDDQENGGFGDDFDEFAEQGEHDDDFGDFDDGFQEAEEEEDLEEQDTEMSQNLQSHRPPDPTSQTNVQPSNNPLADLPALSLSSCKTQDDVQKAISPYLDRIFPPAQTEESSNQDLAAPVDMSNSSAFLSDRSLALWQQLVSPPPTAPINWTRSRIRRLFLVSLGVPVDLDEILPPSKQKRLVLPNINLAKTAEAEHNGDGVRSSRPSLHALDRLRQNDNDAASSTTSLDSKTGERKPSKRKTVPSRQSYRGPPPPPAFDLNAAGLISSTTEIAMNGWTDGELTQHVSTLEDLCGKASGVLEYWLQRKDDDLKEKEALEGVIENLVGFVKGRRAGGKK